MDLDQPPAAAGDLAMRGVADLAPRLREGSISPVAITEDCLQRIERYDARIHGLIRMTADRALAAAPQEQAEIATGYYRGPFHGVPCALRGIVDAAGMPTTAHSRLMANTPADANAAITQRLETAGGILLGKLGTFEFALDGRSWDLPWPPPRNPWNIDFLPGGSSYGPGAAVAARFVPAATGTDAGGSVRWPAAVCGIVGLKPTYGLLSRRGVQPNTFSLDHRGPMTRIVRDCTLMLAVCAGHDPLDPGSAEIAIPDYSAALTGDISGMRVGLVRTWHAPEANGDVIAAVDAAADKLRSLGAIVEEVVLPDIGDYRDCKTLISAYELFAIHKPDLQTRPEMFGAKLRQRVLGGAFIRPEDYLQAHRWRADLTRQIMAQFGRFDALATAGWLGTADPADRHGVDFFRERRLVTMLFSLAGIPALVVACGFGADDLPISLQIASKPFGEATVLRIGDAYQRVTEWHLRAPVLH